MPSPELISRLERTEHVAVFTGAGISEESGVPTFRSADGIWKKFKPEELANFDAFMRNPELVWEWYKGRRALIDSVAPNPGHYALAAMESRHRHFSVTTQNIDNLHRRAGNTKVHELHGNIGRNYCTGCGRYAAEGEMIPQSAAPRCASCGSLVRPDVVWFGEMLPEAEWNAGVSAAKSADVFFAVGTSAVVYPAASLPVFAKESGAYIVEINTERTDFSRHGDEVLLGKSGEILPRIVSSYEKQLITH